MSDLNSLTKEELIALLEQKQKQAAIAEANLALAEERAAQAEEKASFVERKYMKLADGTLSLIKSANTVKNDYAHAIEQYLISLDGLGKEALSAVMNYVLDSRRIIAANQAQLAAFFAKGGESLPTSVPEVEKTVKRSLEEMKKVPSFSNNVKAIGTALGLLRGTALSVEGKESTTVKIQKKLAKIRQALPMNSEKRKTSQGRVNNFDNLEKLPSKIVESVSVTCSRCGGEISDIKTALTQIKVQADSLLQNKAFGQVNGYQVGFCRKCGKVHVLMEPGQDHPLSPERQISTRSMIAWNECVCAGIPLEKAIKQFEIAAGLGSNTCSYSLYDFQRIYLKPLYEGFKKKLQNQPIVLCDETPFDCLQDQGRGKRAADQVNERKSGTNYIVTTASADSSNEPITLYSYSPTRSAANIEKILEGFKFKTLVTDGYTGYGTLLRERLRLNDVPVNHQSCLVHFRRQILLAVLPSDHFKQLMQMPEQRAMQVVKQHLEKDTDGVKLLTALDLIGTIFRQRSLMRDGILSVEESMLNQKRLMDYLDELMMELKEGAVEKKGSRWVKTKEHPSAKVCVYYLNARDELRTFLMDADIPPCTNKVERAIRAVTVLRKNSLFKHSPLFMDALCIGLSVHATLIENNVENTTEFLAEYSRAVFKYMTEKGLELKWKETGEEKTSFAVRASKHALDDPENPYLPENLIKGFNPEPWMDQIFKKDN